MIEMRVSEDDRIELFEQTVVVSPILFAAGFLALKESAINQDALAVREHHALAARDLSGSSEKMELGFAQLEFAFTLHFCLHSTAREHWQNPDAPVSASRGSASESKRVIFRDR